MDSTSHHQTLHTLTWTDLDPRVWHRADGLLLVAGGMSISHAASVFGYARNSMRT